MASHSKEPWVPVTGDIIGRHINDRHDSELILQMLPNISYPVNVAQKKANAERLCKCVNALAGKDPDALEELILAAAEVTGGSRRSSMANKLLVPQLSVYRLQFALNSLLKR